MVYIYPHQGLGDHIICNGLVRHFVEIYNEVVLFCKPKDRKNIELMYQDDDRIKIMALGEDSDTMNYIVQNNLQSNTLLVGFDRLNREFKPPVVETFDEGFYMMMNLPFDYRFSKFKFQRNLIKEKEAFDVVNPNNEPYIFVHGDVDRNKIRTDLKIIENPTEFSIFDLLTIFENAEEIHIMESSIKCLINSYRLEKPKLFYHRYVRGRNDYTDSKGLNKYIFVD